MDNERLAPIARVYEDLKAAKARKKDLAGQIKEETIRHPGYDSAESELVAARNKMKLIKTEALANSGLEADFNDASREVKELQNVLDDLVANAIAEGLVQNGKETKIGDVVVKPVVRVSLKQLSLDI